MLMLQFAVHLKYINLKCNIKLHTTVKIIIKFITHALIY